MEALFMSAAAVETGKKTMETADNLYGVTMQKQGISTLVSVNRS